MKTIAGWVKQTLKNSGTTTTAFKLTQLDRYQHPLSAFVNYRWVKRKAEGWYKKHPEDGNFQNCAFK